MRKACRLVVVFGLSTTFAPASARGQSGAAVARPIAPAPTVATPPPAGAPSSNPIAVPPPPPVDDPMLAPVPAPKRMLGSWQEAIALLHARSTDLKIALDQALQAEAQTRVDLAKYLPTITANGAYVHQIITRATAGGGQVVGSGIVPTTRLPIPDTFGGNVQLTQTLVNVQALDQISIDELGESAAGLSVEAEKRTLVLSLANQLVAVVTAEREAEINRVGLRVALEQLEISKRKEGLGAANGLDVVRAQQNAANARATLVSGDESLREAREALGLALGLVEETGVAPGLNIDDLASSTLESCRPVANVDDRADIAASRTQLEVAKRNLQNVWFSFLPTAGAQSTLSANSTPAPGYPNPTWNIQATVQFPLWDGGARYGSMANLRAAEDIAAQQLEALRKQALVQLAQAQRQLVVAQQGDLVAREQRDLAARNDLMTQTAYMAGQGTSLELVTASEAHRQAEINLALQDFNVVKARVLALLALAACPW